MTPIAELILNVDDNDGARYAKTRVLKHAGYEVIEACTGQGALDQVRERSPALVLLDVKLPDISGIEVCERLKRDPLTRSTLVLQTSAAAVQSLDKVRALDGGADSYLTEPIEPAELVANVRALLRLHHAEEALRAADRRKDQFLATLAHELRNPLAPIRNAVELMDPKYRASDAALGEARMIVSRQVAHLGRLVDDLLDVSRITYGKIALKIEEVEMAEAIATAVETTRPIIDRKGHQLALRLPSARCWIRGDAIRVAQIVGNLLSNAAKYTPDGGLIELDAQCEGNMVAIRVRDNGIGISAETLPLVFDLFVQSERSLARSEGGLGLGLSLARTLTELHGGSIEVFSAGIGTGSEFVVRLPLADHCRPDEPASPTNVPEAIEVRRRVLVVDDSIDSAASMSALLETLGHAVQVAYDGASALALAARFEPEVVVLDIGLPDMDGYQVARALRALPATAGALLIALTGYGQESDRRQTREAGFDQHLVKPALLDDIERAIVAHGRPGEARNAGSPAT